jgi:hypothetical protein
MKVNAYTDVRMSILRVSQCFVFFATYATSVRLLTAKLTLAQTLQRADDDAIEGASCGQVCCVISALRRRAYEYTLQSAPGGPRTLDRPLRRPGLTRPA